MNMKMYNKLQQALLCATNRLESIRDTHPELHLDFNLDDEVSQLDGVLAQSRLAKNIPDPEESKELVLLKMQNIKITNLLGQIVEMATNNPDKLVAFNSPCLMLACIYVYEHNHPDEEPDVKSQSIFLVQAEAAFNG